MSEHICGEDCTCPTPLAPERKHYSDCPTVNDPRAGPDQCLCPPPPPPTPQSGRVSEVHVVSEQIGAFVMEHLAERGFVISRWAWEQVTCGTRWVRRPNGDVVSLSWLSSLRPGDEELDPWECPCGIASTVELDRPPNPYQHATWRLLQVPRTDRWVRHELALFFGVDDEELVHEQQRLLDYVRQVNELDRQRRSLALDLARGEPRDEPTAATDAP